MNANTSDPDFDLLERTCADRGVAAMCDELAASLAARGRWHAVFDLRMVQARLALGLPATGSLDILDENVRKTFLPSLKGDSGLGIVIDGNLTTGTGAPY